MSDSELTVEVAYARSDKQKIVQLSVTKTTTAAQAAQQSGIENAFPEIDLSTSKIGIFGKAVAGDTLLKQGDRVEIYRPLIANPKDARRQRAARGLEKNKSPQNKSQQNKSQQNQWGDSK